MISYKNRTALIILGLFFSWTNYSSAADYIFPLITNLNRDANGELAGGSFFTQIRLADLSKKSFYQIDTGSSYNLMYIKSNVDHSAYSFDKNSDPVEVQAIDIAEKRLPSIFFRKYYVPENSNLIIAGTLGWSFLEYECSSWNFKKNILMLGDVNSCEALNPKLELPLYFDRINKRIYVKLSFGNEMLRFLLDSGSAAQDIVVFKKEIYDSINKKSPTIKNYNAWGKKIECESSYISNFKNNIEFFKKVEYCGSEPFLPIIAEGYNGIIGFASFLSGTLILKKSDGKLLFQYD